MTLNVITTRDTTTVISHYHDHVTQQALI